MKPSKKSMRGRMTRRGSTPVIHPMGMNSGIPILGGKGVHEGLAMFTKAHHLLLMKADCRNVTIWCEECGGYHMTHDVDNFEQQAGTIKQDEAGLPQGPARKATTNLRL